MRRAPSVSECGPALLNARGCGLRPKPSRRELYPRRAALAGRGPHPRTTRPRRMTPTAPRDAVLLLTHSGDFYTVDLVAQALARRGVRPVRFNTDLFPSSVKLSARAGDERAATLDGRGEHISPPSCARLARRLGRRRWRRPRERYDYVRQESARARRLSRRAPRRALGQRLERSAPPKQAATTPTAVARRPQVPRHPVTTTGRGPTVLRETECRTVSKLRPAHRHHDALLGPRYTSRVR